MLNLKQPHKDNGFTLVEMSFVLTIMGLIILTIYPALKSLRTSYQQSTTNSNLQTLLKATAVYVQANGCLPCPFPIRTHDDGFGQVRGDKSASPAACGICSTAEGFPPFISLGLPVNVARDGWGHWIIMRIDPTLANVTQLTTPKVVIPPTACLQTDALPCGMNRGFCSAGFSKTKSIAIITPPSTIEQLAAVLFLSHGANSFGAYTTASDKQYNTQKSSCSSSSYETCNSIDALNITTQHRQFFNASPAISDTSPFDDLMVYADRNNLVAMASNTTCQTSW